MFKRKKKKTGVQTPEFRKPTPPPPPPTSGSNAVKPSCNCGHQPTYTSTQNPPNVFSSVTKPAKEKENTTMYGLKLYCTFEDFNNYIRERVDSRYKNDTFVPIRAEVNPLDLTVEISLISINTATEYDECRYKFDLNLLTKENNKCKD